MFFTTEAKSLSFLVILVLVTLALCGNGCDGTAEKTHSEYHNTPPWRKSHDVRENPSPLLPVRQERPGGRHISLSDGKVAPESNKMPPGPDGSPNADSSDAETSDSDSNQFFRVECFVDKLLKRNFRKI